MTWGTNLAQIIRIELVELNSLLLTLIIHIHVNHTLIWIQSEWNNLSVVSINGDCPGSSICFLSVWQFSSKRVYVTHVLLNKMAWNYSIGGSTWAWIKSFLIGRQQWVAYKGSFSEWAPITFGVPQGSVLGPLLFNIFIADISQNMATNCILFADDTLLYQPIKSPEDELLLQSDLTAIQRWSELNGMQLNPTKTKVVHISRSRKPAAFPNYMYKLYGSSLATNPTFKYLGVTINSSLWTGTTT